MTIFPEIPRKAHNNYHNLEDDTMVKNIFNSRKHKDSLGLKILSWMITDEMKLTDHSRMYALVFEVDVPTTQSQPIESTQGTHRTEIEKLVEGAENVEKVEKLIVPPLGKMTLKQFSALEPLPAIVDDRVKKLTKAQVLVYVAQGLIMERQQSQADDDPHDDAHPEGENSAKGQKTSEYEAYASGESSSRQDNV
nr:hypothetical protein [Tanacetum cinerariifolium]